MFLFAMAAVAATAQPNQLISGSAFEHFARQSDRQCPSRKLRFITPGDLSWEQEQFEAQLPWKAAMRLNAANHQDQRCATRDGLACPTTQTLAAMQHVRMLNTFGRFACSHQQP